MNKKILIESIKSFENFIYNNKDISKRTIVDYEDKFGKEDYLYSEKLSLDDNFDHTLNQFKAAMGFMHMDTLADLERAKDSEKTRYKELNELEKNVIKSIREYFK